jgi:hypothetical protein
MKYTVEQYQKHFSDIKLRFPNARFCISCFKIGENFDEKILCDDDFIIYTDTYITYIRREIDSKPIEKQMKDYYLIKKKDGKKHIYYADVIDELIRLDFIRDDCDYLYLETIRLNLNSRNINSIPCYSSFWGS